MKKLLYTDNIGYSMDDWKTESIKKVFAGENCIMALTEDGRLLCKDISDMNFSKTLGYFDIKQVSISKCGGYIWLALKNDGTCFSNYRTNPLLKPEYSEREKKVSRQIEETISGWHDIVQVAASDAYFALDRFGKVHYIPSSSCLLYHEEYYQNEYRDVLLWENVKRISVHTQNGIFGITHDGKVLCSGGNTQHGARGKMDFSHIPDIEDVYPSGSECEEVILCNKYGEVFNYSGEKLISYDSIYVREDPTDRTLDGNFYYTVIMKTHNKRLVYIINPSSVRNNFKSVFPSEYRIDSFAVGDNHYSMPFVIATAETD